MNSRYTSLVLLAVNVGLVVTIMIMVWWMKPHPSPPPDPNRVTTIENTVTQIAVRKFNATNLLAALAEHSLGWRAIESTNYFFYIINLRNIGCPKETINDIILTDIAKLYNKRQEQILNEAPPFEYWQTLDEGDSEAYDAEIEVQLAALTSERDQLVKDLLGVDFSQEMNKYLGDITADNRLYAFLPPEKQGALQTLLQSFDRMQQAILDESDGVILPADEAQMQALEQQKMEELAKLLTPEELETYEYTLSPLASELRYALHGFDPAPEEFQSIYKIWKTYNTVVESAIVEDNLNEPDMREQALQDAELALESELKKYLGDERFTAYERAQDPDYQFLVKWTDRLQLADGMADQVYAMKLEAQRQMSRVESNLELTYEQRQQAYQALARETEKSLTGLLGADSYRQYRGSGGQWLDQMRQTDDAFELIVPEIKNALEEP